MPAALVAPLLQKEVSAPRAGNSRSCRSGSHGQGPRFVKKGVKKGRLEGIMVVRVSGGARCKTDEHLYN